MKTNTEADDDIKEVEEERVNFKKGPETFATKLIPLNELEKNSGIFQLSTDHGGIKNISLLTSAVKPKDQVIEKDEEWNYDVLHTEITQIVRFQYGEYYQN